MANIIQKSANNQPLSPSQRAFLRLLKSLGIAAFVTLTAVLTQALLTGKVIDSTLIYSGLMAAGYAVLQGLQKYFSAVGDVELSQATHAASSLDSAAFQKFNTSSGGMKLDNLVNSETISGNVANIATEYNASKGSNAPTPDSIPVSNEVQSAPEVIEDISAESAIPSTAINA